MFKNLKFAVYIVFALVIGVIIGRVVHGNPNKDEVKNILYEACDTNPYKEMKSCNHDEINLVIAHVYNGSYMPQMIPGDPQPVPTK